MCTALLAYNSHPKYPLIILSNRDEFYHRPTAEAHFWTDEPDVLGGIDLEKGGAWFGVTKTGRFSLLTNYRDFSRHIDEPLSRGLLTKDYLIGCTSPETYLNRLFKSAKFYNPYNIIVGDLNEIMYFNNVSKERQKLKPGVYGLSNGFLNAEWPKVKTGMHALEGLINDDIIDEKTCFDILSSSTQYPLETLPNTGIDKQLEIDLSSIFIKLDSYGTRMQTLFFIDHSMNANFIEKSRDANGQWHIKRFAFKVHKDSCVDL